MAVKFSIPKSPARNTLIIDEFLGADFTNSPANIDDNKSPNCVNMIRNVPGNVRKRMGYSLEKAYTDEVNAINGYHYRHGDAEALVHVGTSIYKGDTALYASANNAISHSWQFNESLYIIDGLKLLKYDGTTVEPVEDNAYIPTLTIAKAPNGGGTPYEDFNLLCKGFTELFNGTESDTQYHMTFRDLDETTVTVQVLDSNGDWQDKTEETDFTVDRTNGIITFTTAPGVSPITGEDNVSITAYRTVDGYSDRINKCSIGTRFGVNGAFDRLFIAGNPDYINYDWYSQQWDATYFPDTGYSNLGSSASAIVGYSIISNYLATHKDEMEQDLSIILREGDLVDSKPSFKIINTLQGAGAISKNSFNYLSTEPVFLTRSGIYAVTAQDITGEKYAQNRSFYLDGKLLKEDIELLKNSFSIIYNDMYLLAVGSHVYILDGLQPIRTDKNMPYSTRQYVGFYCDNIPARCMWEYENELYFGTNDGKIYKFFNDKEAVISYSDNGEPITACWETADLDGKLFYKNKTFRFLSVKLASAIATSLKIFAQKQGIWTFVKEDSTTGRYFSYQNLIYSKFTYSCNATQRVFSTKLSVKKVDKARFKFENSELNEPFGLFSIALEYQESGNAKG